MEIIPRSFKITGQHETRDNCQRHEEDSNLIPDFLSGHECFENFLKYIKATWMNIRGV
jgi:hypothetical protein